MPLTSDLFKDNQQLQDCLELNSAHLVANEPPKRRGVNDTGDHVALIHQALRKVMPGSSFGLEEATETYGPKTAEVVRQFKARQTPPILNKALGQTVPDNIVGKQTIAALDEQVGRQKPPPEPPPVDPPVAPQATVERLVAKTTFEVRQIIRNPSDDPPFLAIGEALNQLAKDAPRVLRNPIEGTDFDDGTVQSRQDRPIFSSQVMKVVNIEEEVRRLPNIVNFGSFTIVLNITRTYTYSYGVGNSTDVVTVNRRQTLLNVAPDQPRSVVNSTRFVPQPSDFLDPR